MENSNLKDLLQKNIDNLFASYQAADININAYKEQVSKAESDKSDIGKEIDQIIGVAQTSGIEVTDPRLPVADGI